MLLDWLVEFKIYLKKLRLRQKIRTKLAIWHFFGNPSSELKIVGVTGTKGKTTTTTLLYRIAIALGYKAGLIGTVENIINGERIPTSFTTPEPSELNRLLNKMVGQGCEWVFMEVSSQGIDQGRIAGLTFFGGVFTNLTHDHLDYHKTFENYFEAKKKFFHSLSSHAFALSNADDLYGKRMLEDIKAHKYFYGFENPADFGGQVNRLDFKGLEIKAGNDVLHSTLLGKFNAYNILAVWNTCKLLGFDMERVKKILEDVQPPRGRFEHFTAANGVLVVVDYAHAPDPLEKIIAAVKGVKDKNGKLISVFGCGGDRDSLKRPKMGKIGASESDIAIFTTDNPRSEDPEKIIEDMKTGLTQDELKKVTVILDRREAIREGVKLAQKGDVLLVAGKGHETYQDIKGVKSHFDDLEELRNAFS
ncbi:MAG: UDP-N-acetylmuramoyl-L-alanyl-D-glutamate--2,6-diaminopimelate ligase [Candidatus Paceibacterota bacterium]|jgi:UDP-N-acetylmuramoyl-L-alanyl-D-glutamate--2,6-diaminopimelate ligase